MLRQLSVLTPVQKNTISKLIEEEGTQFVGGGIIDNELYVRTYKKVLEKEQIESVTKKLMEQLGVDCVVIDGHRRESPNYKVLSYE